MTSWMPTTPITTTRPGWRPRSCAPRSTRRLRVGASAPSGPPDAPVGMTAADRDLVSALRAELAAIDPSRACDRAAERAGLAMAAAPRDPVIARLAVRLGRRGPASGHPDTDRSVDFPGLPQHYPIAYLLPPL